MALTVADIEQLSSDSDDEEYIPEGTAALRPLPVSAALDRGKEGAGEWEKVYTLIKAHHTIFSVGGGGLSSGDSVSEGESDDLTVSRDGHSSDKSGVGSTKSRVKTSRTR